MSLSNRILLAIRENKKTIAIFVIIFAVGIFLRSYHFSDWLRFNADQARDAKLSAEFVEGKTDLPLLGPKAGGTEFSLGGVFYHFQILSMEIFGTNPAVAAYPDLFFSFLSIILLYFIARISWNTNTSLVLTWFFAISYFIIKYSRFAWNPNSTDFFVMLFLYSMWKIISTPKKTMWLILAGLSLGITVQLHTSLLVIMPILTIFSLVCLWKYGKITKAGITILIIASLVVNIPQTISEIQTQGRNVKQLIRGAANKNKRNSNIAKNIVLNAACHINANAHILTSFGDEDICGYSADMGIVKHIGDKNVSFLSSAYLAGMLLFSVIFSLGGYFFLLRKTREERDENKKIFLWIFSAYVSLVILFFTIWANELSIRFFLPVSFVPFILLGLWFEFLIKKTGKEKGVLIVAVLIFTFLNTQKVWATYHDLQSGGQEINGHFEYITLGEVNYIAQFMEDNFSGEKQVYIDAQAMYLFKSINSLELAASRYNIKPIQLRKKITLRSGDKIIYLKNAKDRCVLSSNLLTIYDVDKCSNYCQFSIFALKVK